MSGLKMSVRSFAVVAAWMAGDIGLNQGCKWVRWSKQSGSLFDGSSRSHPQANYVVWPGLSIDNMHVL